MAYQKQTWNNYNDSLSIEQNKANNAFATAEGLNHIETGIEQVEFSLSQQLADIYVNVKSFGAVGDGISDDTLALKAAFTSGATRFYIPRGRYKYVIDGTVHGTHLASFVDVENIEIIGDDAVLIDDTAYTKDKLCNVFMFTRVRGVTIKGIDYIGKPISDLSLNLGALGATFAYLEDNCSNIDVEVHGENLRYGVRSGDYLNPSKGYCRNIKATVTGVKIGYPIALSLADNVDLFASVDGFHRSIYLAGVHGGKAKSASKNQYGAVIHVLTTNAITTYSTVQDEQRARGCANLKIEAIDSGSTVFNPQSSVCGLGLQWVARGTIFENLEFSFSVNSTNMVASRVGGFFLESAVTDAPFTWEPYIELNNIRVTGSVNRQSQTVATNSLGEVYIRAYDQKDTEFLHCPKVRNFVLENIIITKSSSQTRNVFIEIPNLVDTLTIRNVNLDGIDVTLLAPKGKVLMENVIAKIVGSSSTISDLVMRNSNVTDVAYSKMTKFSSENSRIGKVENTTQIRRFTIQLDGSLTYIIPGVFIRGRFVKAIIAVVSGYIANGSWELGIPNQPNLFGSATLNSVSGYNRFSPLNYNEDVLPRVFNPQRDLLVTFKPNDTTDTPKGELSVYIYDEVFTLY